MEGGGEGWGVRDGGGGKWVEGGGVRWMEDEG